MINFIIGFLFATVIWFAVWFLVEAKNKISMGIIKEDIENFRSITSAKVSPPDNDKASKYASLSYQVELEQSKSGGYQHDEGVS